MGQVLSINVPYKVASIVEFLEEQFDLQAITFSLLGMKRNESGAAPGDLSPPAKCAKAERCFHKYFNEEYKKPGK